MAEIEVNSGIVVYQFIGPEDAWEVAMEGMARGGSLFDFWPLGAPAFLQFINA